MDSVYISSVGCRVFADKGNTIAQGKIELIHRKIDVHTLTDNTNDDTILLQHKLYTLRTFSPNFMIRILYSF